MQVPGSSLPQKVACLGESCLSTQVKTIMKSMSHGFSTLMDDTLRDRGIRGRTDFQQVQSIGDFPEGPNKGRLVLTCIVGKPKVSGLKLQLSS